MSILLFYYALLGVFAITSVVAAPTGSKITPGSLQHNHMVLDGKTLHRVREKGDKDVQLKDKLLDDVINFKKNGDVLHVAHTRLSRVKCQESHSDPLQWCMDKQNPVILQDYFAIQKNYVSVNNLPPRGRYYYLPGYWIESTEFDKVSLHFTTVWTLSYHAFQKVGRVPIIGPESTVYKIKYELPSDINDCPWKIEIVTETLQFVRAPKCYKVGEADRSIMEYWASNDPITFH